MLALASLCTKTDEMQFNSRLLPQLIRSLSPFSGSQEANKSEMRFVPCLGWKALVEQVDHLWVLGAP